MQRLAVVKKPSIIAVPGVLLDWECISPVRGPLVMTMDLTPQ
jgi:hypothetical protein